MALYETLSAPDLGGLNPSSNGFLLSFNEMGLATLYEILALRQAVFVVEQACAYQDADGRDAQALHLGLRGDAGELLAYARIFPPDGEGFSSFGRVLSAPSSRGSGLGREVVRLCVEVCRARWPQAPIQISAQAHLERFYQGFGFEGRGEVYLEDEIPHREMVRAAEG